MQDLLETVVSDHIDIYPMKEEKNQQTSANREKVKPLFRFSNTATVAGGMMTSKSHQPSALICQPDPYNIIRVFYLLNRFCSEIEAQTGQAHCKLNNFLNTFVMEIFIGRIRGDLEKKIDQALTGIDIWTAISHVHGHNMVRFLSTKVEYCV